MSKSNRILCTLLCLITALLITTQCSKSTKDDDEDVDKTPPQVITDLAVVASTSHNATLQWTAPHDYRDDHTNGMIDEYDLRISYDSITAQNFAQAYRIDSIGFPAPAGVVQQCQVDVLEPDSTYYFAMKSRDDESNWSDISNCCKVHCPAIQTVVFADSVLERVIREHIHKSTGNILSTDVDTVTIIEALYKGISSIAGLEYCLSLRSVIMPGNELTDISPLAGLTQIWGLELTGNHISNLTPLAGLVGLHQMHIGENPITDISPLASVTSLQQLWIYATQVTDFSPLYGLEHLDDVHFATMNLTDIGFISHLTHLKICKLNSNNISSISPLSGLTALEGLDLSMNQISNLGPLTGLTNLNDLSLVYNQISDVQPLVDNSGLATGDIVYLGGNTLSQQAIEVQIPALEARGVTVHR